MSRPKCLRCGAGAEWIEGKVPDEPARDSRDVEHQAHRSAMKTLPPCDHDECPCGQPATWTSECMSYHKRPKKCVTHWCEKHAKELMETESPKRRAEWKRHNDKVSDPAL